jgi:fluoride ion exporter CrcB/FEX
VKPALLVGLGGVAGALARHLLGERVETGTRDTLAVNVLGSFLLGALVAVPVGDDPSVARSRRSPPSPTRRCDWPNPGAPGGRY